MSNLEKDERKSKRAIKKSVNQLRRMIEANIGQVNTPRSIATTRIAYSMETALRWASERVVGWGSMEEEVKAETEILLKELGID
jgi:hypothetical protein